MITLILLFIIYLAFISLGLPDSILGVAWPAMQIDWNMPLDAVGFISILTSGSTILSSFLSGHIIRRFGTGRVIFVSCASTGLAILGMSYAPSYYFLLLFAIPLGLGAGSVDTALNNYVALHFKAHHMNWLHSFWGVGASLGPFILALSLKSHTWRIGFRSISIFQIILAAILLLSLPLWKKHKSITKHSEHINQDKVNIFKIKGVNYAVSTFLFYCSVEFAIGLWGSSFLVREKGFSIASAAKLIALYYAGITIGRVISGFISFKLTNKQLIRSGIITAILSTLSLLLPLPNEIIVLSFITTGLGLAPIFPAMIHETPKRFGSEFSQIVIGYQMGFSYIGTAVLPPLLGILIKNIHMTIFPAFLVSATVLILILTEKLNKTTNTKKTYFQNCK